MAKIIQHLRGRYEEYKSAGITPYAGEIALEEGADGYARMKIGDGKTPYLDLPYLSGTIVHKKPDERGRLDLTLAHAHEYRVGFVASLVLSLPEIISEDYTSSFVFDTSLVPPTVSYPKEMVFYGDGCEGGLFFPEERMRYCVRVENRTDAIYAEVCGISHDLAYKSYYEVGEETVPPLGAFEVTDQDRILDVSLCGRLGEANTDGYVDGVGEYDYDVQKFRIQLLFQNGCIVDYEEFLNSARSAGAYVIGKLDLKEEENGFSYLAGATNAIALVNNQKQPLAEGFTYRLRATVELQDCEDTFEVGETISSPFTAYYTEGNEKIMMTCSENAVFKIDFMSNPEKTLTRINSGGIGRSGRLFFRKDSITLVACKGEYEGEMLKKKVVSDFYIDTPLHSAEGLCDTLSLSCKKINRKIEAPLLGSFTLYSFEGTYPVFRTSLPSPIDKNGALEMPHFTKVESLSALDYTPLAYYCNKSESGGVLYFSGPDGVYDVSGMDSWIYENHTILGYAYTKAEPTVEEVSLTSPLIPYMGYTFLMLLGCASGNFLVTAYTNEERKEEN